MLPLSLGNEERSTQLKSGFRAITLCFHAERLFGAASLMLIVRRGILFT